MGASLLRVLVHERAGVQAAVTQTTPPFPPQAAYPAERRDPITNRRQPRNLPVIGPTQARRWPCLRLAVRRGPAF
jgi:hypothetical protein